ncbi:MAG: hypothetical protein L3J19_08590 [Sulfurimonas sp.]|nr:hypothetical protein [Sulfurimonas sp.]
MNTDELKLLLRLQDEPCIFISDIEAHDILMENSTEFMNELRSLYIDWGKGNKWVSIPKKKVIKTPSLAGDFRVMPCITDFSGGIKAVKVIGTNEENRTIKDKISVGKMLLLDWYDNYTYAILDACVLSSFRTAAISLLSFSIVYDKTNDSLGLLGLGRVGFYSAVLLHRWLGITHINCYDNNPEISKKFKKLISYYAPELTINMLNKESVIKDSTSLFLATDSEIALLEEKNSSHLKFISSVGADADNLSELDESIINNRKIITDSIQSMLLGDMKIWSDKKLLSREDVVELKDIINYENRLNEHILFISTGVALQDAIIGQFIVNKQTKKVT